MVGVRLTGIFDPRSTLIVISSFLMMLTRACTESPVVAGGAEEAAACPPTEPTNLHQKAEGGCRNQCTKGGTYLLLAAVIARRTKPLCPPDKPRPPAKQQNMQRQCCTQRREGGSVLRSHSACSTPINSIELAMSFASQGRAHVHRKGHMLKRNAYHKGISNPLEVCILDHLRRVH